MVEWAPDQDDADFLDARYANVNVDIAPLGKGDDRDASQGAVSARALEAASKFMNPKGFSPQKTGRGGRATVLDVGRLAGVSGKTVSRVINGDAAIRPSTLQRIRGAMEALDFRPNQAARSLRSLRSFNLCLLTTHFSSFYFAEAVRGAARACAVRDRRLLIEEAALGQTPAVLLRTLEQLKVDGLIVLPPLTDDMGALDALGALGLPHVRIAPTVDLRRTPSTMADDASGVRALAHHLWRLGHRRFAHAAGPATHGATQVRRESFVSALRESGAQLADIFSFDMPSGLLGAPKYLRTSRALAKAGACSVDALLTLRDRPTALFAFSDEMASGAVARAQQLGLSVPGDLAVAGFDDSDIGQIVHPPLTTIRQPIADMMAEAVRLLIEGDASLEPSVHPVQLIVRGSTDLRWVDPEAAAV